MQPSPPPLPRKREPSWQACAKPVPYSGCGVMEGDVWLEPEEDRWQRQLQTTSFQLALEPPRLVFLQFGGLGWEVVDEEGIWRGSDVSVNHGDSRPVWQVRWHWRRPCGDLAEFLLLLEPRGGLFLLQMPEIVLCSSGELECTVSSGEGGSGPAKLAVSPVSSQTCDVTAAMPSCGAHELRLLSALRVM
uniref:Uncharacterized protein n=1 Tax=Rangifer tarandus platyrhynchus TaxID=3082113 RepID=A0ACB0EYU1_RANTA|nr:unnamed protein product [Rangifer tarandus platyrhynchus]